MTQTLALLHTSPVLAPSFSALSAELLPGVRIFHLVDESLLQNTIAAGRLTKETARRVLRHIESAEQAGADDVLVTCSSIGAAVPLARPLIDVPVMRIDEPMAEAAVAQGPRIGVAATLHTTLEPTLELIRQTAGALGKPAEIVSCLCEGAFEAVVRGDVEYHDRLVSSAIERLVKDVDVVVLAQASMARVVARMPQVGTPILSSPRLAMERVREILS
jgi:Asp/Glu/hydantoin racemase